MMDQPDPLACTCTQPEKQGFQNMGGNTYEGRWWVHVVCGKPKRAWLESLGEDMLNYFRGGPHDGQAYQTSQLLESAGPHTGTQPVLVELYKWTPEIITSPRTGAQARVWVAKDLVADTANESEQVGSADSPATQEEENDMASRKLSLEDRRLKMKVSRRQVADAAGLTEAKIYRICKGSSDRTTDDERKAVADALDALEAELASTPS